MVVLNTALDIALCVIFATLLNSASIIHATLLKGQVSTGLHNSRRKKILLTTIYEHCIMYVHGTMLVNSYHFKKCLLRAKALCYTYNFIYQTVLCVPCYYPHFTEKETGLEGLRSQIWKVAGPALNMR